MRVTVDWSEKSDCGGYESLIGSHIGLRGFTCSSNTIELDTCLEIREIRCVGGVTLVFSPTRTIFSPTSIPKENQIISVGLVVRSLTFNFTNLQGINILF